MISLPFSVYPTFSRPVSRSPSFLTLISLRYNEYENYLYEYKAYKALRGNSFIDRIAQEIAGWEIVT